MNALDYLLKEDFIIIKDNVTVYFWKESPGHYVIGFTLICN